MTKQPLITTFFVQKRYFFAKLAMSQRWSAIFCATGAWGGKPIGRVRVNIILKPCFEENCSLVEEGDDDCFLKGNRDNSTVLVSTNENKLTEKLIKGTSNFIHEKNILEFIKLNLNFYKNFPINIIYVWKACFYL